MVAGQCPSTHESLQGLKHNLQVYLDHLSEAQSQIESSAGQTEASLEVAMTAVLQQITAALDQRKAQLLKEVSDVKSSALQRVESCRQLAKEHLQKTEDLISSVQSADSRNGQQAAVDVLEELASQLPAPCSLPRPGLQPPCVGPLLAAVRHLGRVDSTVSVGRVRTEERPGAVLVQWADEESGEEGGEEDSTYRLQYCYGDAAQHTAPVYHVAYEGPDTSALVRRLQCDVIYSFRVSRQVAAGGSWSDWSRPVTGATTLPHYEWAPSPGYTLTDSGRIACRTAGDTYISGDSTIYSRGAQVRPGAALRVAVVEAGSGCSDEGFALLDGRPDDGVDGALIARGALFVSATGEVYVDGRRRQMRLPALSTGSLLTFRTERRHHQTTRVSMETDDKQVVYDWRTKSANLWLAASFNELGWKLMLE